MSVSRIPNDGGEIAVEVEVVGAGPLVLCIPGMGESRASFRHLVPGLVEDGFRVATMDLRGHGDSSADFADYDDEATARDALAVIDALGGGSAVLVGNSMGAASAVLAAVARPGAVSALVLLGPAVRDHGSAAQRLFLRVLLMRPWGPAIWKRFYASLFGEERPADHAEHSARVDALLRRPGRWRAFHKTTGTRHIASEAALDRVAAPTLVIMGSDDPDFPDPRAEAEAIATATHGKSIVIDGARHYPMSEHPESVRREMVSFLGRDSAHG